VPSLEKFPGVSSKLVFANINEKKEQNPFKFAICYMRIDYQGCPFCQMLAGKLCDCSAKLGRWLRSRVLGPVPDWPDPDQILQKKNRILTGSEFSGKKPDADLYPAEKTRYRYGPIVKTPSIFLSAVIEKVFIYVDFQIFKKKIDGYLYQRDCITVIWRIQILTGSKTVL